MLVAVVLDAADYVHQCIQHDQHQEMHEVRVVVLADAVAQIRTMMVELHHATVTYAAMHAHVVDRRRAARRPVNATRTAVL